MPRTPVAIICLLAVVLSFSVLASVALAEVPPQATSYIEAGKQLKANAKSELKTLEKQWKSKSEERCVKTEGNKLSKKARFEVAFSAIFIVPISDALIIDGKLYSTYSAQLQTIPSTNAVLSQGAAAIADEASILKPLGEARPITLCEYFKLGVKARGNSKVLERLTVKRLGKIYGTLSKSGPSYKTRLAADKAAIAAAGQEILNLGVPAQQEEEWVKISTFSEEGKSSSVLG